jgi:hypothetical protein
MISAMVKYGTDKKRFANLTTDDLRFAMEHLDIHLMQRFQYKLPNIPTLDSIH